jgi:hypothetical protein
MQPQVETVHVPDRLIFLQMRRFWFLERTYQHTPLNISLLKTLTGTTKIGIRNIMEIVDYLDTSKQEPPKTEDTEMEVVD